MMPQDLHPAIASLSRAHGSWAPGLDAEAGAQNPLMDEWRLGVMTSALAAALLEFDRARDLLEQELSQNPDFVALRRLDQANSDESRRQCQALTRRLESLPIFRALQALAASRSLIDGCDAMLMEARKARQFPFSGAMPVGARANSALLPPAAEPPPAEAPSAEPVIAAIGEPAAAPARAVQNWPVQPPSRDDIVRATVTAAAIAIAAAHRRLGVQPQPMAEPATVDASTTPPTPPPPTRYLPTPPNAKSHTIARREPANSQIPVDQLPTLLPLSRPSRPPMPPPSPKRDTRLSPLDPRHAVGRPEVVPQAAGASASDDLGRIQGIDAAMAAQLRSAAITNFRNIAGWRAADVARIAQLLAMPARRISKQGWIEQAAVLATGVETEFARRASGRAMDCAFTPTGVMMSEPAAPPPPHQPGRLQAPPDALPRGPLRLPARLQQVETRWHDEANITIIAQPPAAQSPRRRELARGASSQAAEAAPDPAGPAATAVGAPLPSPPRPAERWMAPATSEEAVVEIVRREDPAMPANRAAEVNAVLERVSLRPVPRPPRHTTPPDLQPTWVSEQDVVAGGVMRRFLKALKRDA